MISLNKKVIWLVESTALRIHDNLQFFSYIDQQAPDFLTWNCGGRCTYETRFNVKFHDVHYPRYIVKKGQAYKRAHLRYLRISIFYEQNATKL